MKDDPIGAHFEAPPVGHRRDHPAGAISANVYFNLRAPDVLNHFPVIAPVSGHKLPAATHSTTQQEGGAKP